MNGPQSLPDLVNRGAGFQPARPETHFEFEFSTNAKETAGQVENLPHDIGK